MKLRWKIALLFCLFVPCVVIAIKYDIDFVVLHFTAQLSHLDLARVYQYNGNLGRYFYPPPSLLLIGPLGLLSYGWAKVVWIVLQCLSFVSFWWLLSKLYPWLFTKKSSIAWLTIFVVAINPIHNNFQSNNIQLMLAAVLLLAEYLRRTRNYKSEFLAGALVVGATFMKVFPGFMLVFYLLQRRRSLTLGIVLSSLFFLASPILWFGWTDGAQLWVDFYQNLTTYKAENSLVQVRDILCLPSLLTRLLGDGHPAITPILGSLTVVFFLAAYRGAKDTLNETHWWALALFMMALLNPSTRPHYFIFYVPAYCSLFQLMGEGWRERAWMAVSVILLAFTAQGAVGREWNNQLESWSIPTVGMLILGVLLTLKILKRLPSPRATAAP